MRNRSIASVVFGFLIGSTVIILGSGIFIYQYGRKVPLGALVASGFIFSILSIISGMALYQSIKHRNDKERW